MKGMGADQNHLVCSENSNILVGREKIHELDPLDPLGYEIHEFKSWFGTILFPTNYF